MSVSSLRVRLLALVLLALIPALGLILYTANEQGRTAVVQVQERALRLARIASNDQRRLIEDARQLLVALAQYPAVRLQDTPACRALFAQLLEDQPHYANLGAINRDGNLFCSALPFAGKVSLADRSYFRRAVQARGFAIGDYQIGRVTKKATVNVAYPVLHENRALQGVVFAALDLASMNLLIQDAQLPQGSTLTMIDRNGTVLVRYPEGRNWVGRVLAGGPEFQTVQSRKAGTAEVVSADGISRLLGFTMLRDSGEAGDAYVVVAIPKEVAFAEADRLRARNLLALGLVGALALAAAWFGGDLFVLRRVNMLVAATRRLAAADLKARVGGPYGGELGSLSRAFNEMAEALGDRQEELNRALQALQESNERLRALIQASPLAIVALDTGGNVTMWNQSAARLFGWHEQEVMGRLNPVVSRDMRDESRKNFEIPLHGEVLFNRETRRRKRDGSLIDVSICTAPMYDSNGRMAGVMVVYADISERKRTELQLERQREALSKNEKLAALGRLAAGVAHELRNPLTVIEARVQFLRDHLGEGAVSASDPRARQLASIEEAAEHMKRVVQGLSSYSKPARAEPVLLHPIELLSAVRELVSHMARKNNVQVILEVPDSLPPVLGDRSQFMQILLNLAINGIEAMAESGGRLSLRARLERTEAQAPGITTGPAGSGESVVIEVADTGPGITPEALTKIWEAFYTTKPEGTGLGLSIVRSLVEEQPGARITVESAPGSGTIFHLAMPAATAAILTAEVTPARDEPHRKWCSIAPEGQRVPPLLTVWPAPAALFRSDPSLTPEEETDAENG